MHAIHRHATLAALLACALLLGACGERATEQPSEPGNGAAPATALGNVVKRATDQARRKIASENISLSGDGDAPRAEITPQGDLLIAGEAVALDERQRALALAYRASIQDVAEAGIEVGVQGADLGMKAASEALRSVFSGNPDQVEERVKTQVKRIEASVQALCDRLPAMLASQQDLEAAVPEFAPYARMDQDDIDECRRDGRVSIP